MRWDIAGCGGDADIKLTHVTRYQNTLTHTHASANTPEPTHAHKTH